MKTCSITDSLDIPMLMMSTVTRYRSKASVYNERVQELNSVTQERDDIKKQYDEWRKRRQVLFNVRMSVSTFGCLCFFASLAYNICD